MPDKEIEQPVVAEKAEDSSSTLSELAVGLLLGSVGGGAAALAAKHAMKHKDEIRGGAEKVINEVKSTPADVINHIKEKPIQAAAEALFGLPVLVIGSKLDKLRR